MSQKTQLTIFFNEKGYNNYVDVTKEIKELLEKYLKEGILVKNEAIKMFLTLKEFLVKGKNSQIYEEFVNQDVSTVLINILNIYINFEDVELLKSLQSFIITITDNSEAMCEELVKFGLPSILIDTTINVCDENFKKKCSKKVSVEDIVAQLILIIHNIARNNRFQQPFIQHEKLKILKDKLIKFLGSDDKRTRILTMTVLTWLAEDDEKDRQILSIHESIIDHFREFVIKGMKDSHRRFDGLDVWELLLVLQALSGMSYISQRYFMEPKFINAIIKILKSKSSLPREQEISIGILWNLSFTENNKEKLKKEFDCYDTIKNLLYKDDDNVRKKALDFLWYLGDRHENEAGAKKETKYDIFVSYCHAQSAIISKLVTELMKRFSVWVDTEGIKGSGLSDMADGIERSKAVVMAVSPSYKQSQCCHSEASWAYRLKKPIIPLLTEHKYKADGWLGMMISTETYIDVSDAADLARSLAAIEEHIGHKTRP